ncbi:hypothetical protein [Pseudomonas sp. NBRC 100443]|uniref:hypothetical protein n=1 Tax=Pseudomonas sp. NBRC 100443 TaxID=1113665 RepID=UPI0024A28603|nr:hypothetical protein [Pseudomonas sp. NBRC 100443]GLU42309.1 hypothetical protein Pssp01_64020 [Pseudomonas sp. NBRC 100443]
MAIRVYTSLDTGAPVLTGSLLNRLKQIYMACLVNGYGSKPAAGWTVGHQSADGNGFSLSNGDGYINFVSSGSNVVQVYLLESITDGSAALAVGANRRSASWFDGSSSGERQTFYSYSGIESGSNPHWVVAADDKTVIFVSGAGVTAADITNSFSGFAHYFGRYISALGLAGAAEFVSLGGANGEAQPMFAKGVSGTALRNPFTGLVDQGDSARYGAANVTYASEQQRSRGKLLPSRLLPVRAGLQCAGPDLNNNASYYAHAGHLRGVISEPTLCASMLSEVLALFGLSNTWQARVQPITLPNGKQWYPMFATTAEYGLFISLDPDDWV